MNIISKIKNLVLSKISSDKYYKLSKDLPTKKTELIELYKDIDSRGNVPKELAYYIKSLLERDDIVVGIHHTSSPLNTQDFLNCKILKSIFNDGLKNYGDLSSGVVQSNGKPNVSKTVAPIGKMLHAIHSITGRYKNSRGCILCAFPKEYVTEDLINKEGCESFLYNEEYIKPEFLLGYIDLDEKHNCTWYPKELFLDNVLKK